MHSFAASFPECHNAILCHCIVSQIILSVRNKLYYNIHAGFIIFITGGNAMRVSVLQPWFQKVLKGSPYYWSYATVVYVFLARSEKPQINSLVDLVTPDIITYFYPDGVNFYLGCLYPLSLGAFYCIAATIAFYRETRPTKIRIGVQGVHRTRRRRSW